MHFDRAAGMLAALSAARCRIVESSELTE